MSESKGKILFVILAILLLLFGGGTILYPSLNGLWVERTMHRDSEDFLLLLEEDAERTAEEIPTSFRGIRVLARPRNHRCPWSTPNSGWI